MKAPNALNSIVTATLFGGLLLASAPAIRAADTPKQEKTPESVSKSGTLTVEKDIVNFTPALTNATLAASEKLQLLVLVSASGKTLDEDVARAGKGWTVLDESLARQIVGDRHLIKVRESRLPKHFRIDEMEVLDPKEERTIGVKYCVYDVSAELLKDGVLTQLDIKPPTAGATVSAAIGVFDSKSPNYEFIRFATPVSTTKAK